MSVLTDIIAELKSNIDSMTTPTYNFNYDDVDERRPSEKTYPNVLLEYPEEIEQEIDGNVIDSYSVDKSIHLVVTVDDTTTPVDTALDNVLEDFKRLLEADFTDMQTAGLHNADLLEASRVYTNVRERPGMITIIFNFKYRVRRSDPSLTI